MIKKINNLRLTDNQDLINKTEYKMEHIVNILYNFYNKRYDCYKEHQYIYNFYVNKIGNEKVIEFLYTLDLSLLDDIDLKVLKYTKQISKKNNIKIKYTNSLFNNILYSNKKTEEKLELFEWLENNNFEYKYFNEYNDIIHKRKIKEIKKWNKRQLYKKN